MVPRESKEGIYRLQLIFYFLLLIYVLYLLYDILFGDFFRIQWTFLAILLVLIPFAFEKFIGMYFPWEIKIIIVISLLLHTAGEFHRLYYSLTHYDKISHLVSAMGIAYLVFLFVVLVGLYYGLGWRSNRVIFFILFITFAFGLFWEWWEIFSDHYFGSKFFWDLQDGIGDLVANIAGMVFVALNIDNYLKGRSWEEIARDFVILDGNMHYRVKWEVLPATKIGKLKDKEERTCKDIRKEMQMVSLKEENNPSFEVE